MKFISQLQLFTVILASSFASADESKSIEVIPDTEPTFCYKMVWGTKNNPGLGLTVGQAVELCSGATDAKKVITCFFKAWAHPDNDGLGLTAGQAVDLCKNNSLQDAI